MHGRRSIASLGALLLIVSGCAAPGAARQDELAVAAVRIDVPVRTPVWSGHEHAIVAATADRRIATIDVPGQSHARMAFSNALTDVGRNIVVSPIDHSLVYIPQPDRGQVAVLNLDSLQQVSTLQAGSAPSLLALNSGAKRLLALSADGSQVTPVDLHVKQQSSPQQVDAGPTGHLQGTDRGRLIEFHVTSPGGIVHYKGTITPVDAKGEIALRADASAADPTKVTRLYFGERGTDRLVALDSERGGFGLHIVGTASVGGPIRYLGTDDKRIFVATDTKVVVFQTDTFEGFADGRIDEIRTFEYRHVLPDEARSAPLSGLVVGPQHVYLTLQSQPYIVSVVKHHV